MERYQNQFPTIITFSKPIDSIDSAQSNVIRDTVCGKCLAYLTKIDIETHFADTLRIRVKT
jgi:hypothetical protein